MQEPETLLPEKQCIFPSEGEMITSLSTNNTYTIGPRIGEGNFSHVFACADVWENDLAVKVLKPLGTYDHVKDKAVEEFQKLVLLRHPNITYVYDAFEYRDTFYIVTERCYDSLECLFSIEGLQGIIWLRPIARCLLQAVHYLHINQFVHQDIHIGNIFAKFIKDEMNGENPNVIQFKLGDLGVGKFITEVSVDNVRAQWMLPPEIVNPDEFGPIDHRIDLYHLGLVLLQLALSTKLSFTRDEILEGRPRQMALALPQPLSFAIEKTLRRHVMFRTESVLELWRDLNART